MPDLETAVVCTCPDPERHAVPRAADLNVRNARAKAGVPAADIVWAKDDVDGLIVHHTRKRNGQRETRTLVVPRETEAWAEKVVRWLGD